jgi:hypothetical protein
VAVTACGRATVAAAARGRGSRRGPGGPGGPAVGRGPGGPGGPGGRGGGADSAVAATGGGGGGGRVAAAWRPAFRPQGGSSPPDAGLPSESKYPPQHASPRGPITGPSTTSSSASTGSRPLEPGWLTNRQIEARRIAMTRKIKRGGKVWINVYPDKP